MQKVPRSLGRAGDKDGPEKPKDSAGSRSEQLCLHVQTILRVIGLKRAAWAQEIRDLVRTRRSPAGKWVAWT
jgi:hypothetical protein